jgi:uncharacterized protein Yka (UPF0111/DUF47 family)
MKRWFLPREPDVLGLLCAQAEVTIEGMVAFEAWTNGDATASNALRDSEHRADDAKRDLQRELRAAFSTPLDAEDIYELSERLDEVVGGARDLVLEAEALSLAPDAALAEMAGLLVQGVRDLADGFAALPKDADGATSRADAAKRTSRQLEHAYQAAMSATVAADDPRLQFPRRELYRRASRIADAVIRVAERIWYAVVKQS